MLVWIIAFLALLGSRPVWSGEWSLGSQIGAGIIQGDVNDSGSSAVLAWPANTWAPRRVW
jgi:hypothetical protein